MATLPPYTANAKVIPKYVEELMAKELKASLPHLLNTICGNRDPHRGTPCVEGRGHTGDHKSIGGFPWENEHDPRPKYQGASDDDMAAVEELLGPGHLEDAAAIAEAESTRNVKEGETICPAIHNGFVCTRPLGHSGEHIARYYARGGVADRWKEVVQSDHA